MSCGCSKSKPDIGHEWRARAVMCQTCPYAGRSIAGVAVSCTVSGLAVVKHIEAKKPSCPKQRHGPLIRWLWIMWYGVPMPIRIWMRDRLTGPLPGCGCIRVLKDAYSKEAAIWNDLLRSMVA